MKRILFIILCFVSVVVNAQQKESWNKANELYSASNYTSALEQYQSIENAGYSSKELFYNIGNCYFKLKDYGHSILNYERALKFDPSDKDVLRNIEIARDYTPDKIEVLPEFILRTWIRNLNYSFSANTWSYTGLVFLSLSLLALLSFKFNSRSLIKKLSFVSIFIGLLLTVSSFLFSLNQVNDFRNREYAIIMKPVSSVKSSPDEAGKDVFILHEGTKVKIIDKISRWNRVILTDGRDGWIQEENLEII